MEWMVGISGFWFCFELKFDDDLVEDQVVGLACIDDPKVLAIDIELGIRGFVDRIFARDEDGGGGGNDEEFGFYDFLMVRSVVRMQPAKSGGE
jgi:hypothetical protein